MTGIETFETLRALLSLAENNIIRKTDRSKLQKAVVNMRTTHASLKQSLLCDDVVDMRAVRLVGLFDKLNDSLEQTSFKNAISVCEEILAFAKANGLR